MKNFIPIFCLFFILFSCKEEELIDASEYSYQVAARTAYTGVITGSSTPYVGEGFYTYQLKLTSRFAEKALKVNITASPGSGTVVLFRGANGSFNSSNIEVTIPKDKFDATFDVMFLKEESNVKFIASTPINSGDQVSAELTVNPKVQGVSFEGATTVNYGSNVTIKANYPYVDVNHRATWNYDKTLFELVSETKKDGYPGYYQIILKPKKGKITAKVGVVIDEKLTSTWYTVRKAERSIEVLLPYFKITTPTSQMCAGNEVIYKMSQLGQATGAQVTWNSNTAMTLKSGQGTSQATYQINSNASGNYKVTATVSYLGTTFTEQSDPVWVGMPVISSLRSNITQIGNRVTPAILTMVAEGGSNITYDWQLVSGNATLTKNGASVTVRSTLPSLSSETITIKALATNGCGTTSQEIVIPVVGVEPVAYPVTVVMTNINGSGTVWGDIFIHNAKGETVFEKTLSSSYYEDAHSLKLIPGKYIISGMGTPSVYLYEEFEIIAEHFIGNYWFQISLEPTSNRWGYMARIRQF